MRKTGCSDKGETVKELKNLRQNPIRKSKFKYQDKSTGKAFEKLLKSAHIDLRQGGLIITLRIVLDCFEDKEVPDCPEITFLLMNTLEKHQTIVLLPIEFSQSIYIPDLTCSQFLY